MGANFALRKLVYLAFKLRHFCGVMFRNFNLLTRNKTEYYFAIEREANS